jgi:hypothetical protein
MLLRLIGVHQKWPTFWLLQIKIRQRWWPGGTQPRCQVWPPDGTLLRAFVQRGVPVPRGRHEVVNKVYDDWRLRRQSDVHAGSPLPAPHLCWRVGELAGDWSRSVRIHLRQTADCWVHTVANNIAPWPIFILLSFFFFFEYFIDVMVSNNKVPSVFDLLPSVNNGAQI